MPSEIAFPIETPRLLIRPMQLGDAEDLHEVYADVETMQHLETDLPRTVEESREWVKTKMDLHEKDGLSLWAVVERRSGRVIGDCGLQWEDIGTGRQEVCLGGRGNRAFWRQGYGIEAALACMRAGFERLELERISASTAPDNVPARRLLDRIGMVEEGSTGEGWPVYFAYRETWRPPEPTDLRP